MTGADWSTRKHGAEKNKTTPTELPSFSTENISFLPAGWGQTMGGQMASKSQQNTSIPEQKDISCQCDNSFLCSVDILSIFPVENNTPENATNRREKFGKQTTKRAKRKRAELENAVVGGQNPSKRLKASYDVGKNSFMVAFFKLLDDDIIREFLWMDQCAKISDKYLLSMVYAYFRRAQLHRREFNRLNFFLALYLANDMEEDEEDDKYDIFPWALGKRWRELYPAFLVRRDMLWRKMEYRAVVSRQTCEEVMSIAPDHPIWYRSRRNHHGGAWRDYERLSEDLSTSPRGPESSPVHCSKCKIPDKRDIFSPVITSDYSSGSSQSMSDDSNSPSSFDMKGLRTVLPASDQHGKGLAWLEE